ncbi:MarR family transcriptional regulator [Pseudomaricurvus alkylphenolicus]|jgi:DNA-binding MarR family transcriptional regulator|uniref:MarR family winged helix-turn-helix transcriptional regulator n=1 Tax=Pseudomaricurvus alkylphenolicus TaxID=1306991 RepID=UPI0014203A04|nr:MarR family transcriptional regulator [Pseudomaricurvus alkylphenolicus]NIB40416.1 MarR family transcriptional regulator [Pseudomaricurvus alkylphenolicus]
MQSLKSLHKDDSDTLYLKLWLQLARSSKVMEQEMETRFQKNFKQSLSRFDVLSQLDRCDPDWLPMGKLAGQLIASKGNITRLVDRMISEGLIDRRPSPEDRRIIQVGLTDKGRSLFAEMAVAHADWAKSLLGSLDIGHGQELLDLLVNLNRAVKANME